MALTDTSPGLGASGQMSTDVLIAEAPQMTGVRMHHQPHGEQLRQSNIAMRQVIGLRAHRAPYSAIGSTKIAGNKVASAAPLEGPTMPGALGPSTTVAAHKLVLGG